MKLPVALIATFCLTACGHASIATLPPASLAALTAEAASTSKKSAEKAISTKLASLAKSSGRKISITSVAVDTTSTRGSFTFTAQIDENGSHSEQSGTYESKSGKVNVLIDTSLADE